MPSNIISLLLSYFRIHPSKDISLSNVLYNSIYSVSGRASISFGLAMISLIRTSPFEKEPEGWSGFSSSSGSSLSGSSGFGSSSSSSFSSPSELGSPGVPPRSSEEKCQPVSEYSQEIPGSASG